MKGFIRRRGKMLAFLALASPAAFWLILGLLIGRQVDRAIADARPEGAEDDVAALVRVAADEERPLAARNRAVWALGQLGDPAALPVLERLATGRDCDHARDVCQKEVRKAIEGCRGATNLTAILWRQAAPRPSGRGP